MRILNTILGGLAGALLVAACGQATADDRTYSEVVKIDGLAGVPAWANAQAASPETAYLTGMSEAMLAIEHVLQVRYANYSGELPLVPGGQANITFNPDAEFDPAFVENAMLGALEHFAKAETALSQATGKPFTVEVDLKDLWFDVDADGERGEGEDALLQIGALFGGRPELDGFEDDATIRFDTADADWLAAYVNVASGSAELILSVDPTSAIEVVFAGNKKLAERGLIARWSFFDDSEQLDTVTVILTALDGKPDPKRTRAALAHFKKMITHNENFWNQVEQETDNEKEWLPNANQVSAFGVEVTAETAEAWRGVLSEMSDVLHGRKLIPHWRFAGQDQRSVGINIESLLTNPGDFDIVLMLHGASFAEHVEQGPVVERNVWRNFARTVDGRGNVFALWLN